MTMWGPSPALPELWGGIECTVNRVGDRFRDQTMLSGHHDRIEDLDLFAGLGLRALRYPVLWERTIPDAAGPPDWTWSDRRLARLRALNIRPIVGLVHHGSGPAHTDLLDGGFVPGVARYARLVATRYPWIEDWTPINEPLTTARFSALYGHWHPHRRDDRSFWLALLNQVDATRAAMHAIRRVNPAARLIQTDDLGHTHATAPLTEQAEFDNQRRWAGWDLLFGLVTPHHPLFAQLDRIGLGDRLRRIADDPCPPDIVGVNHYLTSDRFLDHRLDRYPAHLHGGNGDMRYADTEAIRVLDPPPAGLRRALSETWERYRTPIAITEVHNGCTREEQMRWAAEAWDTAVALRGEGADIHAVTAWALLGSHGWDTLLTDTGTYEPGVFEIVGDTPRHTALAALWRGLPLGHDRHPVVPQPGWWRRPERLLYPPRASKEPLATTSDPAPSPLLVRTRISPLGDRFADICAARGIACRVTEADMDGNTTAAWGVVDLDHDCVPADHAGTITVEPAADTDRLRLRIVVDPAQVATCFATLADTGLNRLIDGAAGHWPIALPSVSHERSY